MSGRCLPSRQRGGHDNPVLFYLSDIGTRPLLTKDDEARLSQAIHAGRVAGVELAAGTSHTPEARTELRRCVLAGRGAAETLVTANLRLVVSVAKKYQAGEVPLPDLVQEGNLGLMHAAEKFDWRKGFKFSTYATWWIRQAILRGIANTGRVVRLPTDAGARVTRLIQAGNLLESQLGRRPTVCELAVDTAMSEERVAETLRHAAGTVSLSDPIRADSDDELGDMVIDERALCPFEAAAAALLPAAVAKMLAALDDREREIVRMRYGLDRGEPRTFDEIAAQFALSPQRVRQIEVRAITKLRDPCTFRQVQDMLQGG